MKQTLPTNSPAKIDDGEISATLLGFGQGVWHPEDLVRLAGTPWIVVSAMRAMRGRGALLAIHADSGAAAVEIPWHASADAGRRSEAAFDPHGIDVYSRGDGQFDLLVVDHGDGEAIDRLRIETGTGLPTVVEGTRIDKPAGTSGNAVAFLPAGGFVMTSMFDPGDPDVLGKFAEGAATGGVWRWDEREHWRRLGPALSGANGVAVAADGQTIFVSEWSARRVWKLSIDGTALDRVDVDFLPDNLRWTERGDLLLAGQIDRPERVFGCEMRGEPCSMAYALVRLDPESMRVKPLLRVSHEAAIATGFGGATGALEVDGETWIGSFTGERIARYRFVP